MSKFFKKAIEGRAENYRALVNELGDILENIVLFSVVYPDGRLTAPSTQAEDLLTVAMVRAHFRRLQNQGQSGVDNDWFADLVSNIMVYEILDECGEPMKPEWRVEAIETLARAKKEIDLLTEQDI